MMDHSSVPDVIHNSDGSFTFACEFGETGEFAVVHSWGSEDDQWEVLLKAPTIDEARTKLNRLKKGAEE